MAAPSVCACLRHAAAAQRGELITTLVKKHHLIRLWLRHRQCKPACSKWDTLKKHLKDNFKLLTCKKINNNNKVMHKSALARSGKLHNLHIIRIFLLHCLSSAFRRVAHLTRLLLRGTKCWIRPTNSLLKHRQSDVYKHINVAQTGVLYLFQRSHIVDKEIKYYFSFCKNFLLRLWYRQTRSSEMFFN